MQGAAGGAWWLHRFPRKWLSWTLWHYMTEGYARGETSGQSALNLPVWPFRAVFTLAFATLALQVLCELLKSFVRRKPGAQQP